MLQEFTAHNFTDAKDNPAGGDAFCRGMSIVWQDGPLGRGAERKEPNGAFVETVIAAALQRIEWYQTAGDGKFSCDENHFAITYLKQALRKLEERTKAREDRGVEGTHQT